MLNRTRAKLSPYSLCAHINGRETKRKRYVGGGKMRIEQHELSNITVVIAQNKHRRCNKLEHRLCNATRLTN